MAFPLLVARQFLKYLKIQRSDTKVKRNSKVYVNNNKETNFHRSRSNESLPLFGGIIYTDVEEGCLATV